MIVSHFLNNPEFIKNARLEFNATRLGLSFILLFILVWLALDGAQNPNNRQNLPLIYFQATDVIGVLCGAGFLFTIVWGSYLAAGSMTDEIKEKTWDFVRMSSLSPAKILAGKLFGSTSVVWTVTLFGILPLFVWAGLTVIPDNMADRPDNYTVAIFIACLILWTVLSHTLAILMPLVTINYNAGDSKPNAMGSTLIVLVAGFMIGGLLLPILRAFFESGHRSSDRFQRIQWYDFHLLHLDNMLLILCFFCFWSVVAVWRLLGQSLQFRYAPAAWIAFLVTTAMFLNGYTLPVTVKVFFVWPVIVGVVTLFFTCPGEAWNIIKYKRILSCVRQKKWMDAFRFTPLWVISFLFIVFSVGLNFAFFDHFYELGAFSASTIALACRDILAVHVIFWTRNIRRPLIGFLLYFSVMYVLWPLLAVAVFRDGSDLFFPLQENENAFIGYWVFLAAQLALFSCLLSRRWKEIFGQKLPVPERGCA